MRSYYLLFRQAILTWGATRAEAASRLPGDELLETADGVSTRAIEIDVPAIHVRPWLAQMGPSPRGGAYTYDWIENLLGLNMHSVERVLPEFQHPEIGDAISLGSSRMRVERVEPHHALAWRSEDGNWVWTFVLAESGGRTRLISRNRFRLPTLAARIGVRRRPAEDRDRLPRQSRRPGPHQGRPIPARKTLEELEFAFQTSLRRDPVLHLGQLDFLAGRENVILLGPPGTGKTHLAIALGIRACLAGQRVAFKTATEWVALLADAQRLGRLDRELDRLQRIPLLIVDEVGYIPFDPQAANLMFMLVSRRYERASLIVTSNKPFSGWGEIFGDDATAAAVLDRLVHHVEILALKGDSYRLKDRDLARPTATPAD